jgi:small subunit ribosomal protein S8
MAKDKKIFKKMVGNYPVGDFLIRLKNASLARKKRIEFPAYNFVVSVAKALKKEGYLREVRTKDGVLEAALSYMKKEPLLTDIKIVSKPGVRIYMKKEELEKIKSPSIFILSTPKGVMSSKEAISNNLGGEVIAKVL